jgi:hypothetical protein
MQWTSFAAGALALFLVIGAVQVLEKRGAQPTKPAATADSGETRPQLTAGEFASLDRDGSGFLTPDEVKGNPFLERNFERMDANHDGRVSLEEYTKSREPMQ